MFEPPPRIILEFGSFWLILILSLAFSGEKNVNCINVSSRQVEGHFFTNTRLFYVIATG